MYYLRVDGVCTTTARLKVLNSSELIINILQEMRC
jgi:hypothetical protein